MSNKLLLTESRNHQFNIISQLQKEIDHTPTPPVALLIVFGLYSILPISFFIYAIHYNSMTAYFWTTIALFPLGILAITIILHMLRKWGRGRITTILEMALEYDPQTIIECWSIAYNNVDRSVTLAMEEVIHNNLEIALPSMEDCPKLHKPLLYSIYKNWNLEKKNLLIAVSLEYFSKFGTKKEYNSLKLATKSFKHAFVGSNTNARVNHDRDEIVKRWRSRIENDRMSIMSDVSQLLRPTEHGNHDLLKPVLRNEKETENLLHPSIWPGEHSDVMETKVDEQNSQDK